VHQTYFSPKTEKRRSGIEGRGLFAKAPIAQGETVVVKGGYVMTTDQRNTVAASMGPADIQIAEDLHIGPIAPEDREGGMMHLNHSCAPNLGLQGQIVFVALRDISQDEELTFDYAMTDDDPHDEMQCNCGVLLPRDYNGSRLAKSGSAAQVRRLFFLVHPEKDRCPETTHDAALVAAPG
jgi:hypothetical protein